MNKASYEICHRESEKLNGRDYMGRHRHRWKHNIKINLRETVCEDVDWIHLAHDMD
jgi:hypothetical protein